MSAPAPSGSISVGPDRAGRTVHVHQGRVRAHPAPGAPVLACPEDQIEPGAVNAHTHLYSGLAPLGLPALDPAPGSFLEILERRWWRMDRALTPDSLRAAARLYLAEALLAGTTGLVDHHESPSMIEGSLDVLAAAFEELGARGLLTYGATERNGGPDEAAAGLAECRRFAVQNRSPRLRALVGLHAGFTVSDETIRAAAALCGALGLPLHVHVAEDGHDVTDARDRRHAGPLERLLALGALPPGSVLAHGVHLTHAQVTLASARRCWLVHNPRSNEGNGVGFAANLGASDRVALGTDGWPAEMIAERNAAVRLGLSRDEADRRLSHGHALLAGAFLATPAPWSPGAPGDLVVRRGTAVLHVVVDGRLVVKDGHLVHADLDEIRAAARAAAPLLWAAMARL